MVIRATMTLALSFLAGNPAPAAHPLGVYGQQFSGGSGIYVNFAQSGGDLRAVGSLPNNVSGGGFPSADYGFEFAVDSVSGELVRIDTSNAAISDVGPTELTGAMAGPRWNPVTGQAYVMTTDCSEVSTLYRLNPGTGALTQVGVSNAVCLVAIAFDRGGNLFGVNAPENTLVAIDTSTAQAGAIGAVGPVLGDVRAIDFDGTTNVLYVQTYDGITDTNYLYAGEGAPPISVGFASSGALSAFALAGSTDSLFVDGFE